MDDIFLKPYDSKAHEDEVYKRWEESGFFNPDNLPATSLGERTEPYSIVLPPPNVTGTLHMGHAAMLAIQDILIRFNRMSGKKALWVPGTDHAAIATQSKVEKEIYKKEKKSRHDLGREEFLGRVKQFAQESHDIIVNQIKKMGSSVDWSREAFTLDEKRTTAVYTAFKNMYDDGLIYRKARIVNWDPKGQTTVSDDEVDHVERKATLYTFKYFPDFPISIATTRPETKVGDTAVAVNPEDGRYKEFVGKTFSGEFAGVSLTITIIADESVDKEFGTGALGVTPAHSQIDWEIAERNNISERPQVINEYAKMTNLAGPLLTGKKVKEAQEIVVLWLKENNLLENEEEVSQNISTAERTGGIIEPLPKLQWWIDTEKEFVMKESHINGIKSGSSVTLKQLMKQTVESGQIEVIPERFKKTYYHWIDNLRPWCISRQIWYGHRIPVWYKGDEICVAIMPPESEGWEQDPDTLDTWFSSGLWTFSTLGWPEQTEDLKTYHPTNILETGHDILFFWVARMILMSGYHLGDIPFKTVYLHGLVKDEKGRKMSKSLDNTLDPLDMIEKYGADATRLSLIIGATAGNDLPLSENRVRGYKHFANKIWNISRFVLTSVDGFDVTQKPELTNEDQERINELNKAVEGITKHIETYRLDLAADTAYHYVWHTFADVILEESKPIINGEDEKAKQSAQWTLYEILTTSLKLLHPFMPFVTETIWSKLPQKDTELLIVSKWPSIHTTQ